MKAWVTLSVICLIWSSAYDLATWKGFLQEVDPSLPTLTAGGPHVCYYFDPSQSCSNAALGNLLGLASDPTAATWTPTGAPQCEILLDQQRAYAEEVAADLFAPAIASSAAVLTDFKLMVQTWVLRVGHHSLKMDHAAFVAALNGVTDWTTVACEGANLVYNSASITLPDFITGRDCAALEVPPQIDCSTYLCDESEYAPCCQADCASPCCKNTSAEDRICSDCDDATCKLRFAVYCCNTAAGSACCGNLASGCADPKCSSSFIDECCAVDNTSACCLSD